MAPEVQDKKTLPAQASRALQFPLRQCEDMDPIRKKTESSAGLVQTSVAQPQPGFRLFASRNRQVLIFGLVLVLGTAALYYPVSSHPFANYDDDFYVTQNAHVKSGLHWETVTWAFTTYDAGNWHPLTWLAHALDFEFFQLDPSGHHDVNVLLHVLNVALLFLILLQATGYAGRSFVVAALFAWHPINVESVAWIAERKNLLSMFFFLLALAAYRWYARRPQVQSYLVVMSLYALGLMAKPQVITLPFVLLLWDHWPLRRMSAGNQEPAAGDTAAAIPTRSFSSLVLEKLPLLVLAPASALVTMKAQRTLEAIRPYPLWIRLENAIVSYARYIGKLFWPLRLTVMYPYPVNSLTLWQLAAAVLFLLVVTAWVVRLRHKRYLLVGWLWFLGTLVPMIGLVQVGSQAMADRYAYLPAIGLFIMICWGVADWAGQRHLSPALPAAASLAVLLALTMFTRRQIDYWSDDVALWSHAVQVTNGNWLAESNLGKSLMAEGHTDQAMPHFRASEAINPYGLVSHWEIAVYEYQHRNFASAIQEFHQVQAVTRSLPIKSEAYINAGFAYLDLDDYADARESFQAALDLKPLATYRAWMGMGVAAQKSGDLKQAIQDYSRSIKARATDISYLLLSRALEQSGRTTEAHEAREKAKALSTDFAVAEQKTEELLRG